MAVSSSGILTKMVIPVMLVALGTLAAGGMLLLSADTIETLQLAPNTRLLDRHGQVLRHLPAADGQRHLWVKLENVAPVVQQAFITAEDQRFYRHRGVDLIAIARAVYQNITQRRIVSGASTITQQLVRRLDMPPRSWRTKFRELGRSLQLERQFDKATILEAYLNRVPLGNNVQGVELAANLYFGLNAASLTPAQAALLAALPKAPERLNPYGPNQDLLLARRNHILQRMQRLGYLDSAALQQAYQENLPSTRRMFAFEAPHFVNRLLAEGDSLGGDVVTSLELGLQKTLENILQAHAARLHNKGAEQAAAIVVHNASMEVRALVGSIRYAAQQQGFNDGTRARRSAGSTLKPFAYALALERGVSTGLLLEDTLQRYMTPAGDYLPYNYNRYEHGPVSLRTALGNSLNTASVKLLQQIGLEPFYKVLQELGLLNTHPQSPAHYGLGLVLGNAEVSLRQLAAAYTMLARGGVWQPLRDTPHETTPAVSRRLFSEETAYIISDMLSDAAARQLTFGSTLDLPFRVSVKTGTSTGYRDAWALGYTSEYTIGVWCGNFDGRPTQELSGAVAAAPILKDILLLLYHHQAPPPLKRPPDVVSVEVCGISGMLPGPGCRYVTRELFGRSNRPQQACSFHSPDDHRHRLPGQYSTWVFNRHQQGYADNYSLAGLAQRQWQEGHTSLLPGGAANHLTADSSELLRPADATASRLSVGTPPLATSAQSAHQHQLRIDYPLPGDRFVYGRFGIADTGIRFEVRAHPLPPYVDWFVNQRHAGRRTPPYHLDWQPERGHHSIMVSAPQYNGDTVSIVVE